LIHWEGRGRGSNPVLGGEDFPSLPAVVVSCCHYLSLSLHTFPQQCVGLAAVVVFESHCRERARNGDHPVSRGQGEPLRGQRLRTANQGASCGALQLGEFNPAQ